MPGIRPGRRSPGLSLTGADGLLQDDYWHRSVTSGPNYGLPGGERGNRSETLLYMNIAESQRDRILNELRVSSRPLDDDELSRRLGISPRQRVNQICRELAMAGLLARRTGPEGKLVNVLIAEVAVTDSEGGASVPTAVTADEIPLGSSREQREAERVMLDLLGAELGVELNPAVLIGDGGTRVAVDGADPGRTVLTECWAHHGVPKSAQRHKVLSDAFKLAWLGDRLRPRPRLILCMADPEAAAPFRSPAKSWAASALERFEISVQVVTLPEAVSARIREAQQRQYR